MDTVTIEDHALGVLVRQRIHDLWKHRAWFRSHVGWIVQEQVDERAEMRYLISLARKARIAAAPEVARQDAFTTWKRARDLDPAADHFVYPAGVGR